MNVYYRNHNLLESADQDPGVWEGGLVARNAATMYQFPAYFEITVHKLRDFSSSA